MTNKSFLILALCASQLFSNDKPKNKVTIYKDLAIIDREENIHSTKDDVIIKGLPKTIFPSSLFIQPHNGEITESTLEDDQSEKKLILKGLPESGTTLSITYAMDKIYWTPYYTVTFSPTCDAIDFHGAFEIENDTDTTFSNVSLQLHNAPSGLNLNDGKDDIITADLTPYDLPQQIDLRPFEKKRLTWTIAKNVQTTKEYRLDVGGVFFEDQTNKNETPTVELWVSCLNKLKPLPMGNMIVYQKTVDDQKQALTKLILPTTKVGQIVAFKMPEHLMQSVKHPFQVTYEQTEFQRFTGKLVETANRITVQNTSDQPVVLKIMGKFPTKEGVVLRESIPHQNLTDDEFYWTIELPPKDKAELRYRLRFPQEN